MINYDCLYFCNERSLEGDRYTIILTQQQRVTDSLTDTETLYCVTYSEPYCQSGMFVCLSVAGRASGRYCCCIAAACCCVAAVRSRRDSGSRQTLLVLQFLIEFANIWAQYSPSTYASTHVGFFWSVPYCPNGSPLKLEIGLTTHCTWRIVPIWLVTVDARSHQQIVERNTVQGC